MIFFVIILLFSIFLPLGLHTFLLLELEDCHLALQGVCLVFHLGRQPGSTVLALQVYAGVPDNVGLKQKV